MEKGRIVTAVVVVWMVLMTLVVTAAPEKIYVVNLNYDKEKISLIKVYVKLGYAPGRKIQPEEGYRCEVISFKGEKLDSFKFMPPTRWFYDYIDPETGELAGGIREVEVVDFTLVIPYFPGGKRIDLYNPQGEKILEIDVSQFAEVQEEFDILPIVILALIITFAIILWRYKLIKIKEKGSKEKPNERVAKLIKEKLGEGEDPEVLKKGLEKEGYNPRLVDEIKKK